MVLVAFWCLLQWQKLCPCSVNNEAMAEVFDNLRKLVDAANPGDQ